MTLDIESRGVSQRFHEVTALDDLSVRFEGGRIHGLLGRNGSGKTTLLSILAGYRRPTRGAAFVAGQPVFENRAVTPNVCLIRGSGDTVEHDWPEDRVRNALDVASTMWPNWDTEYATKLVDRFDLDLGAHLPELSTGQRSAVGVVLGLASRAPVTMLDESYLGMDAPSRYTFYDELLADFLDHPRTFIISTHLIGEVGRLFDHVTIIERGRALVHDDADAVRSRGFEVTGPADTVDRLTGHLEVLSERQLGGTKAVAVHGELDPDLRRAAERDGLEVGPLSLQDLFVHLTRAAAGDHS